MTNVAEMPQGIRGLDIGDLQAVLRQRNPKMPAGDLRAIAKIVALVVEFVADLSNTERRELARWGSQLRAALEEATQQGKSETDEREHIEPAGRVQRSRGAGLGEQISVKEGRARLEQYAIAGPIERWAGPVAGAGEIEQQLGIPRSTLNSWQQRGAVVGLLRGERKLAYPLEQFVDARPLEGIAEILRWAPDARGGWLWLRQPNTALGRKTPLACLREGRKASVLEAAQADLPLERDFA
jgi:hypothetical protein